jgi:predicted amidophosphoribosyltransferase
MRERHLPRLCRHCQAPMAGQGEACWRCGTEWATEAAPRTTLRLIPGDAQSAGDDVERAPLPVIAAMS